MVYNLPNIPTLATACELEKDFDNGQEVINAAIK